MRRDLDLSDVPKENFRPLWQADPSLIPPDLERCQAFPNMLKWSPFTLGPRPKPVQCESAAVFVAIELLPGADGKRGSMSLCPSCAHEMEQSRSLMARVVIEEIARATT